MKYALPLALAITVTVAGQQRPEAPRALTAADYARAERFMTYNTTPLVLGSGVRPTFLPDDRFWYRTTTERGSEAVLVDPAARTKSDCTLPACRERADGGRGGRGAAPRLDVPTPDGKRTVFIRDWNLWIRDVATGKESPLTRDGVKDFGYATDNAGWIRSE